MAVTKSTTEVVTFSFAGRKPQEDKHRSRFQHTAFGHSHFPPGHSVTRPDPQLDLSPLKSPSNEKPQKQKDPLCKSVSLSSVIVLSQLHSVLVLDALSMVCSIFLK